MADVMTDTSGSRPPTEMTRRTMIALTAGAIATVTGCQPGDVEPLSERALIAASALSGEPLDGARVLAQKPIIGFLLAKIL